MNPTVHSPNEFFKRDSSFWWRPGRVFIPAMHFTGMSVGAINEGGAGNFVYGAKWEGSHTGAPISIEIGTTGHNAIIMDTAGDMVTTYALLPADFDSTHPMYIRVHWSSGSSTTADTIDWLVTYTAIVPNTTAIITPATALSAVIPQDTVPVATADVWCTTEFGRINGGAIAINAESALWMVEMDAFAAGLTEAKHLLGLELRYTPKRLHYGSMRHEAKASRSMLSDNYS